MSEKIVLYWPAGAEIIGLDYINLWYILGCKDASEHFRLTADINNNVKGKNVLLYEGLISKCAMFAVGERLKTHKPQELFPYGIAPKKKVAELINEKNLTLTFQKLLAFKHNGMGVRVRVTNEWWIRRLAPTLVSLPSGSAHNQQSFYDHGNTTNEAAYAADYFGY